MSKRDYYDILGLRKGATADEIKRAYRKLAMQYHPDRNPGDAKAEASFKDVGEAYEVLRPAVAGESRTAKPDGLSGRVVAGYQGWFRAEGDGSGLGFFHYHKRGRFEPGACTIDLWPDMSEMGDDESEADADETPEA